MGKVRIEKMPGLLEEMLKREAPDLRVRRILSVHRSPGGLSSESYWVKAETDSGHVTWVMRMEPPGGVLEPYDIPREYAIQKALADTDIPVARPVYLQEDAEPLGGRFMLMEFIEGEVHVYNDPIYNDLKLRASVGAKYVEMLARLHKTPPPDALKPPADGYSSAQREVQKCKRRLQAVELLPHNLTRYAIKRLEEAAPEDERLVIVHGDYRLSNMIWRDGEIIGLLDWERTFLGDPMAEIAFDQLEGLHGWSSITGDYLRTYSKLTGIEVDEKRLAFFRLLEFVKVVLVGLSAPAVLACNRAWDLRLFSVGSRGMATEAFLLALIQGLKD